MISPSELKKLAEDFAEFDRTDFLRMLLLVRKECFVVREMLYIVCASKCRYDYTKAEVDAMIEKELKKGPPMTSLSKLKGLAETFAEFERIDLLRALVLLQKECTTLRKMLYHVYDSDFSYTKAEVDAMIKKELEKP